MAEITKKRRMTSVIYDPDGRRVARLTRIAAREGIFDHRHNLSVPRTIDYLMEMYFLLQRRFSTESAEKPEAEQ